MLLEQLAFQKGAKSERSKNNFDTDVTLKIVSVPLIFTTLWANSADKILILFPPPPPPPPRKWASTFHANYLQSLKCQGLSSGKIKKIIISFSFAELAKRVVKIEGIYCTAVSVTWQVGLDFQPRITKMPEDKDAQRQVLSKQIELANKFNLPL